MALSHQLVTLSYGRKLIWGWDEIHLFLVHTYTGEGGCALGFQTYGEVSFPPHLG